MTARGTTSALSIVIYRITGRQGLVSVPDWVCRECDLTVAAVAEACRQAHVPREAVVVKPWLTHVGEAWRLGARHPPAVLVGGHLYSQAVVPDVGALAAYLRRAEGEGRP
ncbi:MAG: hypothetical protein M0Z54_11845 [Thermaerobacter sp.]|nr:hypothetical protein [Thermaerobacter sp.]